jgi:hypothetical protein
MKILHIQTKSVKILFKIFMLASISCVALSVILLTNHQAHAACDPYRPCAYTTGSNGSITVNWYYDGGDPNVQSNGVNYYQIRWSANSGSQTQAQVNTSAPYGSYTLNNVNRDAYYGFIVQACETHFLAPSSCTAWSDIAYYAPYGPDTCLVGYVWRQAYSSSDHVCVAPATRAQAAYDNSQAAFRVNPNGPYGPDTCVNGYVWREADAGIDYIVTDHVCVTPATRAQAAYDNSQAASRRLFP